MKKLAYLLLLPIIILSCKSEIEKRDELIKKNITTYMNDKAAGTTDQIDSIHIISIDSSSRRQKFLTIKNEVPTIYQLMMEQLKNAPTAEEQQRIAAKMQKIQILFAGALRIDPNTLSNDFDGFLVKFHIYFHSTSTKESGDIGMMLNKECQVKGLFSADDALLEN